MLWVNHIHFIEWNTIRDYVEIKQGKNCFYAASKERIFVTLHCNLKTNCVSFSISNVLNTVNVLRNEYEMKSYINLISGIVQSIMKSDFTAICTSLDAVDAWMVNANVCFYEINSVFSCSIHCN